MSKYERYDRVAADYDRSRIALGADVIADCLARGPVPLERVMLIDAGCGTGNYSAALVGQVFEPLADLFEWLDFTAQHEIKERHQQEYR